MASGSNGRAVPLVARYALQLTVTANADMERRLTVAIPAQ